MNNSITKLMFTALSILVLSGCLTEKIEKQKKADALQSTLYSYANALRWGYFDEAYNFRKYEKGEYPDPPKGLNEVRVSAYDVIYPPTMIDDDMAVQLVEIHYYFEAYQRLKTLRDREVWVFDQKAKRWYLDSPIPAFQ